MYATALSYGRLLGMQGCMQTTGRVIERRVLERLLARNLWEICAETIVINGLSCMPLLRITKFTPKSCALSQFR